MSDLRSYLDSTGSLPPDVLLGRLAIYTIYTPHRDGVPIGYDRQQIADTMARVGLSPQFLPARDTPVQAYRKATQVVQDVKYPMPNSTNTAHILVRPVVNDANHDKRAMVREIIVGKKRLDYATVVDIWFNKPSPGGKPWMHFAPLPQNFTAEEGPQILALCDRIEKAYQQHLDQLDAQAIRTMVRAYLKDLNAALVKDGVYFIPIIRDAEMQALAALVNSLGHGCQMELVSLMDLVNERETVMRAVQETAVGELRDLRKKIVEARTKKSNAATYARLRQQYDSVVNRVKEYMSMLDTGLDYAGAEADITMHSLLAWQQDMANPKE